MHVFNVNGISYFVFVFDHLYLETMRNSNTYLCPAKLSNNDYFYIQFINPTMTETFNAMLAHSKTHFLNRSFLCFLIEVLILLLRTYKFSPFLGSNICNHCSKCL